MKTGTIVATAVAAMMLAGGTAQAKGAKKAAKTDKAADAAKIHCTGINACKGQGACMSASNSCSGANSCKGKGWVEVTSKECKKKGGSVLAEAEQKPDGSAKPVVPAKTADKAEQPAAETK